MSPQRYIHLFYIFASFPGSTNHWVIWLSCKGRHLRTARDRCKRIVLLVTALPGFCYFMRLFYSLLKKNWSIINDALPISKIWNRIWTLQKVPFVFYSINLHLSICSNWCFSKRKCTFLVRNFAGRTLASDWTWYSASYRIMHFVPSRNRNLRGSKFLPLLVSHLKVSS